MATVAGWLSRTETPGRWIVRAPLFIHRQHFVPELGKSAKCNSPDFCILCAHNLEIQECGILPLSLDGTNTIHLLRLLEKDRNGRDWCERRGSSLVGTILDIQLVGYVELAPVARRVIPTARLERYIAAIGRKAYLTAIEAYAGRPMPDRESAADEQGAQILNLSA
jgi:hypothetical protein